MKKIKKLATGIVLTGVIEDNKTIERFVKPGEVVTVHDFVLPKLDALKESYEVVTDVSTKPVDTKPADKKGFTGGDKA